MFTVAAFYRFTRIDAPLTLRDALQRQVAGSGVLGTTILAAEGINGTMAGSASAIERYLEFLNEATGLPRCDVKFSRSDVQPFRRLKLKVKREIITFRADAVDPSRPGKYVEPEQWNSLLLDPDVLVLDTRNTYESAAGTFDGAFAPPLENFSAFATYVDEHLDPLTHKRVAMFCTGGIRCEKASAYMLQRGFGEVYHLKGGILRYLEEVGAETSRWQGECYIFDERGTLTHNDFARDQNAPGD